MPSDFTLTAISDYDRRTQSVAIGPILALACAYGVLVAAKRVLVRCRSRDDSPCTCKFRHREPPLLVRDPDRKPRSWIVADISCSYRKPSEFSLTCLPDGVRFRCADRYGMDPTAHAFCRRAQIISGRAPTVAVNTHSAPRRSDRRKLDLSLRSHRALLRWPCSFYSSGRLWCGKASTACSARSGSAEAPPGPNLSSSHRC